MTNNEYSDRVSKVILQFGGINNIFSDCVKGYIIQNGVHTIKYILLFLKQFHKGIKILDIIFCLLGLATN